MKIKAKAVIGNGTALELREIDMKYMVLKSPCILSIDGATVNTGIGLIRISDGAVVACVRLQRETAVETAVEYKVEFKKFLKELFDMNRETIKQVVYEEPYIGHEVAVAGLYMMKSSVAELKAENKGELDYIEITEISNKKWKSKWLGKETEWITKFKNNMVKCKTASDREKMAIKCTVLERIPLLKGLTQDEYDAISMGKVAVEALQYGKLKELKSKSSKEKFAYEIRFVGSNTDDEFMGELEEITKVEKVPKRVLENGIILAEINSNKTFEGKIFENMGEEDKLLILKWKSGKNGSVVLKYKLGNLIANYKYVYALIWRRYKPKV